MVALEPGSGQLPADLAALKQAIGTATGGDRALDAEIARALQAPLAAYTGSVDAALGLVDHALPGWGWHVGWHADGIRPYATLHDAERTRHVEAAGPSVPIALLRAMMLAREQVATAAADGASDSRP
jgi:hypothetical protein